MMNDRWIDFLMKVIFTFASVFMLVMMVVMIVALVVLITFVFAFS